MTRRALVTCDRCGQEATPATEGGWIQITTPLHVIQTHAVCDAPDDARSASDLCVACGVALAAFLRNQGASS